MRCEFPLSRYCIHCKMQPKKWYSGQREITDTAALIREEREEWRTYFIRMINNIATTNVGKYTCPASTHRCFNVVLTLILGRDVKQLIFNVETPLLISTLRKQHIFSVASTSEHNVETTSDFKFEATAYFTTSDFNVETTSDCNVQTTSYFNVETTSDYNVETTSYFNIDSF